MVIRTGDRPLSLDKSCEQDLIGMNYTFFGGAGAAGTKYYEYGKGQTLDTNPVRGIHSTVDRGNLYKREALCFQTTGLPLSIFVDKNTILIPAATLVIANSVFVAIEVVVPIDEPVVEIDILRGRLITSLGGGFFLNSEELTMEVIKR